MEMTKNAIAWVEIPVIDLDRAKKFYETIFDFEMPVIDMGPIKMGMLLYDQEGGGVGGALCHGEGYQPSGENGSKVYLNGGDDLSTVLGRVEGAGGKVVVPKTEIGQEMGNFAFFNDSEGNFIGLHSMG